MPEATEFKTRKALSSDLPSDGIVFVPASRAVAEKVGDLQSSGAFHSILLQAFVSQDLAQEVGTKLHGDDARVFAVDMSLCKGVDLWLDEAHPERMAVWGNIPAEAATLVTEPSAAPGI